jgi:uracil-DNA glycosylase
MTNQPSTPEERRRAYDALVLLRKQCGACVGLVNPSECANGVYDSDHIGPWSLWQGSLAAKLMIIGQDWGDERYFLVNGGRDAKSNPTNEMLRKLLMSIGIEIETPEYCSGGDDRMFFTNALLCLKTGGMQAKVGKEWFAQCASRFLRRNVEIVTPSIVVTLGECAYRALTDAYRMRQISFRDAVDDPAGFELGNGTRLFPVYLCSRRILNTHRNMEQQRNDWERIRVAMSF